MVVSPRQRLAYWCKAAGIHAAYKMKNAGELGIVVLLHLVRKVTNAIKSTRGIVNVHQEANRGR